MKPHDIHMKKAKIITEVFKDITPKGWLRDVISVSHPNNNNLSKQQNIKTIAFDIITSRYKGE